MLLAQQGKHKEAYAQLDEAIRIAPDDGRVKELLVQIRKQAEKAEKPVKPTKP